MVLADLTDDIQAYWSFDTNSTTQDSLVNNIYPLTASVAQWTTSNCKIGGCYNFRTVNSTSERLQTNRRFDLNSTDFTVTAWGRSVDYEGQSVLWGNLNSNNSAGNQGAMLLVGHTNYATCTGVRPNQPAFFARTGANNDPVCRGTISTNQYYFYVYRFKNGAGALNYTVYDTTGKIIAFQNNSKDVTFFNQKLYVGNDWNGLNWNGTIDEMGIWYRVLTDAEIHQLWNGGAGYNPYGSGLRLNALDFYTSSPLYPVIYTQSNGSVYQNLTGSSINLNYSDGNYTFTASVAGYIDSTATIEHLTNTNYNFNMLPDNRINVIYRDEQTQQLLNNVSYSLINPLYSRNGTSLTGLLNFTGIPIGSYQLRYQQPGYAPRSYYFIVPISTSTVANTILYLLDENEGSFYLPIVLDENQAVITDSFFHALRWYPTGVNTGEYRTVETSKIDDQGRATMFLEFNTVGYTFRAFQNNTIIADYPTPKFLFNQEEFYVINTGDSLISSLEGIDSLVVNLTFQNGSMVEYFQATFSDGLQRFGQVCLVVSRSYGITESINTSCSTSNSGTLTYIINSTLNPGFYTARVTATGNDGVRYVLDTLVKVFSTRTLPVGLRPFGLLVTALAMITALFLTISAPLVGVFMLVFILAGFGLQLLGLHLISSVFIGGITIGGIVLAVVFRRK